MTHQAVAEINRRFDTAQATQKGADLPAIITAVAEEYQLDPDALRDAYRAEINMMGVG